MTSGARSSGWAVCKIVEKALEAEVTDVLGRDYFARSGGDGRGYRNGYRTGRLRSAEGPIEYATPQVSDREEPFRSRVRGQVDGRTDALEQLAIEMYARGLSTRDIEAAFCGPDGQALLSRTAVSELTEKLWDEYEAFVTRDLAEHRIVYLFVDGIAERLRPGQPREAVLGAWGSMARGGNTCSTWPRAPKKTRRAVGHFFKISNVEASSIRCSSTRMGRPG